VREPIVAQTVESTEKNMEEIRYKKRKIYEKGKEKSINQNIGKINKRNID